ncbi:MAG: 3-hydroxyisobutyrate dehydrogenase [Gammaproteobacteria bacterium]
MKKIAFVGLGNMGLPMAGNLAKKYRPILECFDIRRAARTRAAAAGLPVAETAVRAVRNADRVITMLPAGAHVRAFYRVAAAEMQDETGGGIGFNKNAILLDCSTTSPEEARETAATAARFGARFLDAPVSGGIGGAKAGSLSFLVGGDKKDFAQVRPLLGAMGANIFHAGDIGDGQAAKLCNNMMLSVQMIGVCEALALGQKMRLDGGTLSEIMRKSSGGNWVLETYNPLPGVMPHAPAARNYRGGFLTDLMVKDSDLAMRAAENAKALTPLGAAANQLYRLHQNSGNGGLDFSSILKMFAETGRPPARRKKRENE